MVYIKTTFLEVTCEDKPCKIEVRIVRKNVLVECTYEELYGRSLFVDDEIYKIVEDACFLNVVGKLLQYGVLP